MQTFLVPVDFSAASNNALEYAAQLARLYNARLLLFHAYMLPTPVSEVPYVMITADELKKENEKLIERDARQITKKYQVETDWQVRIGIASDEVKAITREMDIDFVIIGMKGAGGFEKIIGSTTTNVLHKVKTPVLIIPHDAGYKTISSIVYASDFSYQSSFHLFDPLQVLLEKFNSALTILHVQLAHSSESPELLMGKKDIAGIFEGQSFSFVTVENNSITQGINLYLGENGSDLLVMVAHKHGFFERIFSKNHTDAMAYETHIPMLVLQDKG